MRPSRLNRLACATRLVLATLAAGLVAMPYTAWAQEVTLEPMSIEMQAKPGLRQRQFISITNADNQAPVSLTLGLADWSLDRDGTLDLAPPGAQPDSVADWVQFSPAFVTLAPGAQQSIIVDIIVPAHLGRDGDYRFALLASAILPDTRPGHAGLLRRLDRASLFYLTAGQAVSEPSILDIRFTQSPGSAPQLVLLAENTGNAHARLDGEIRIEGRGEGFHIPVSDLVVLDGARREFTVDLPTALPDVPQVTAIFQNVFAPQAADGTAPVISYSAPLSAPGRAAYAQEAR